MKYFSSQWIKVYLFMLMVVSGVSMRGVAL